MSLGVLISVFFLLYRNGELLATSEVRSVPLGKKRKPGRPKKLPMCLSRMVVEEVEDEDGELYQYEPPPLPDLDQPLLVQDLDPPLPLPEAPLAPVTRKRKRLDNSSTVVKRGRGRAAAAVPLTDVFEIYDCVFEAVPDIDDSLPDLDQPLPVQDLDPPLSLPEAPLAPVTRKSKRNRLNNNNSSAVVKRGRGRGAAIVDPDYEPLSDMGEAVPTSGLAVGCARGGRG